jgi:hypothetical protein
LQFTDLQSENLKDLTYTADSESKGATASRSPAHIPALVGSVAEALFALLGGVADAVDKLAAVSENFVSSSLMLYQNKLACSMTLALTTAITPGLNVIKKI